MQTSPSSTPENSLLRIKFTARPFPERMLVHSQECVLVYSPESAGVPPAFSAAETPVSDCFHACRHAVSTRTLPNHVSRYAQCTAQLKQAHTQHSQGTRSAHHSQIMGSTQHSQATRSIQQSQGRAAPAQPMFKITKCTTAARLLTTQIARRLLPREKNSTH